MINENNNQVKKIYVSISNTYDVYLKKIFLLHYHKQKVEQNSIRVF